MGRSTTLPKRKKLKLTIQSLISTNCRFSGILISIKSQTIHANKWVVPRICEKDLKRVNNESLCLFLL